MLYYTTVNCNTDNELSEPEEQSPWECFLLRQTINPYYQIWSPQTWFDLLHQHQSLIKEKCPKFQSAFDPTFNPIIVASPNDVVDAFASTSLSSNQKHSAAWSSKPFPTYVLYSKNVLYCGDLYFLAQVDKKGLPIDTLVLDDTGDRPDKVELKCHNIERFYLEPNATLEGLPSEKQAFHGFEQIVQLEFLGNIPGRDFVEEVPKLSISVENSE
ncbi:unnamed protein product [Allacma fusca]|uniref:Uncharacterized protein n=1 Tax=Allacma fusca TaxID=39272 RepID=A0A8J2PEW0_9HEXA|nr:unnamed protein product [Allacma fusca]